MNVMITGTGRSYALGFNFVLRYLENGDNVVATARKASPELDELKAQWGEKLTLLMMDIGDSASVNKAAGILQKLFEERREDREGHRFITNKGEDYPF